MLQLVNDYLRDNFFTRQNIQKSSYDLNVAACRLILVIMPGLETSAVFQVEFDNLIHRLYSWAENSEEPLRSYATGLLAAAMEVQDIAIGFREQNSRLVTIMLKRLHILQAEVLEAKKLNGEVLPSTPGKCEVKTPTSSNEANSKESAVPNRPFAHLGGGSAPSSPELTSPTLNGESGFNFWVKLLDSFDRLTIRQDWQSSKTPSTSILYFKTKTPAKVKARASTCGIQFQFTHQRPKPIKC